MPHVFDGLESNRKTTNVKPLVNDYINTQPMGWIFRNAGYETVYGGKFHIEGSWGYRRYMEDVNAQIGILLDGLRAAALGERLCCISDQYG